MLIWETLVLTAGPSSLPRMCEQRKCIGRNASGRAYGGASGGEWKLIVGG